MRAIPPRRRFWARAAGLSAVVLVLVSAAFAGAEISQVGGLRVTVGAEMRPTTLPRTGNAPVAVSVSGHIAATGGRPLPQLKRLAIRINRHGHVDFTGLPTCAIAEIQPATTAHALSACRPARVGEGTFEANILLKGQAPYPSKGRLVVFNGREHGRHVLLGHIYTRKPFTNSFVIVFRIVPIGHGTYGTALVASLPRSLGHWGYVTGIEMTLSRRYSFRGRRRSYLSAGCPAPRGYHGVAFPLARTSFAFANGRRLASTINASCTARG